MTTMKSRVQESDKELNVTDQINNGLLVSIRGEAIVVDKDDFLRLVRSHFNAEVVTDLPEVVDGVVNTSGGSIADWGFGSEQLREIGKAYLALAKGEEDPQVKQVRSIAKLISAFDPERNVSAGPLALSLVASGVKIDDRV